jgi:sugar phosphate permease
MALLPEPVKIRWWIFSLLFGIAALVYLQRTSFGIIAPAMMADLHISHVQFGWLKATFAIAYAVSQVPSAALGQWLGARKTYVVFGILGIAAMLISSASPYVAGGAALFVLLLLSQMLLGISHGPVFPMFAAVMQQWFPEKRWALVNGMQSSGMDLGGLVAAPLLVLLMQSGGWKGALLWLAIPAVVLTAWWGWYGRNMPEEHASVRPEEIADLAGTDRSVAPPLTLRRLLTIAMNRDVLALAVSYLCMNFAFYILSDWSFLYLVEVRHLQGIESGLAGAMPWLGAALGAGVGGALSDHLATRIGPRWGDRLVPVITLPLAGVMLLVTTHVSTPYAAVAGLTATFALIEFNEGAYWTATMRVARADTGAASGVLNTGGNLGGVLCGPALGYLTGAGAWSSAFGLGMLFCLAGALLWLVIDTERRLPTAA